MARRRRLQRSAPALVDRRRAETLPAPTPAAPAPAAPAATAASAEVASAVEGVAILGRKIGPVAVLLLLAPFMAEVLSGASSLLVLMLFPPFLILDLGLYGAGALLIREAVVRWGRGWPSILTLGVGFAIVEEGLVVSSFTDPLSPPRRTFDAAGTYGAGPDGSNWVWIPVLCIFHAVVSIAFPILVVQLAYPSRARGRWLSGRGAGLAVAAFAGAAGLGRAMFSSGAMADGYLAHIAGWEIAASVAAIAGLALLARHLPVRIGPARGPGRLPSPPLVASLAAMAYVVYFMAGLGGGGLGLPPAVALGVVLGVVAVAAVGLMWVSAREGWSDRHRFAVPAGVAAFYLTLSPLLGPVGLISGFATAYALWRGWRHLRKGEVAASPAEVSGPPAGRLTGIRPWFSSPAVAPTASGSRRAPGRRHSK